MVDVAARQGAPLRVASAVLFLLAGAGFVVLSFFAGFFFLVAFGVDVPTPIGVQIRLQVVAAACWVVGLVVAIAGLVVWIRGIRRRRPTLRWALADLAVMVALTAVVLVNSSIGFD